MTSSGQTTVKTKARKRYLKAKKDRRKQRRAAAVRSGTASANHPGRRDDTGEDIDYNGERGDGHVLDSEEERPSVVKDVDEEDAAAHTGHEKTNATQQPRKKRHHHKEAKSDAPVPHAEDATRPRKRQKLSSREPSPSPLPSAVAAAASSSQRSSTPPIPIIRQGHRLLPTIVHAPLLPPLLRYRVSPSLPAHMRRKSLSLPRWA
ncbi:hypothetical protein BC826DRAFT_617569 [Russula brevipes]|nr:hypothetical protein BC826DRAFT_617569 [Russula brevipes]